MSLNEKTIELLRQKFPDPAIQIVKKYRNPETGGWVELVGFKPAYIIERLNDAFGHEGWDFTILQHGVEEVAKTENGSAWVLGRLTIYTCHYPTEKNHPDYPIRRVPIAYKDQFGYCGMNKQLKLGDALKGAATNSLEKAASLLDIGHEAYKGIVQKPEVVLTEEEQQTEKLLDLKEQCSQYEIGVESFVALTKNVLGKEVEAKNAKKELSIEDLDKLIAHVKKHKSPF